jgi:hypothetical protein
MNRRRGKVTQPRRTKSASEPALLSSLREAIRDVVSDGPSTEQIAWAREFQEFTEEIRRFKRDFGPLIEEAATVQHQLRRDPEVQRLGEACAAAARIGSDGILSPDALELGSRLLQIPALSELGSSAASRGCKGMGFLTANVEAAIVRGGQAGAELVWLWPYKIGTFKTPNRVVGRAWYMVTRGFDFGYSLTVVPFPLDLSFWFVPPENTKHMVGAYLGYEGPPFPGTLIPLDTFPFFLPIFAGLRVEIFGWVPEKPTAEFHTMTADPELTGRHSGRAVEKSQVNPFKYIFGFRILAEVGGHIAIGVARQGHQVVASKTLDLSTYYISPTNLQAGKDYNGTDPDFPLIEGAVSAPLRGEQPSKTFNKGSTTLKLTFPDWMCTALSDAPTLVFKNDGSGGTAGWSLTNSPTVTDLTYEYQWTGTDNQAWQDGIAFTIEAHSSGPAPKAGKTLVEIHDLNNVGVVDVPVSYGANPMCLTDQVFSATGSYTLDVDADVNTIEDYSGDQITESMNAGNSDACHQGENDFYYLSNPNDASQKLIIDETDTGDSWYVGYQFRQQSGKDNAQFRAVFWKTNSAAIERNYYAGNWQPLEEPSQQYTSVATWSGGNITDKTTLTVTLSPKSQ